MGDGSLVAGLRGDPSLLGVLLRLMPLLVTTTGGVVMAMAFLAFGKRRRGEQPTAPDDVLAASAATGYGQGSRSAYETVLASVPEYAPPPPDRVADIIEAAVAVPSPVEVDAHLPRWRRPSLIEARKADPSRTAATDLRTASDGTHLTFTGASTAALDGLERRRVRYRLVSLLDAPDEVRGVEIGSLDEGDEVVLLEKHGTYWQVLCPDGRKGWLHKMTLGGVVVAAAGGSVAAPADDTATLGSFEDILLAYSETRRQFSDA